MEEFSPSRVSPVSSEPEKNPEEVPPRAAKKARMAAPRVTAPAVELENDDDEHQLDEQA